MAFALIFIAVFAVGAMYSSARTVAHIGQPGWICGETLKGGLICRPDPNYAAGQRPAP
jgi:hypothetical protein